MTTCAPRWATERRPDRPTLGGRKAKVATKMGVPYMPWQRLVSDVAGEYYLDDDGHPVPYYREIRVTVPRQSGKTTLLVPELTSRCIAWPSRRPQNCIYTAQTGVDGKAKWLEHVDMIESSPLAPLMTKSLANGSEGMRWPATRSTWGFKPPTKKAGHGKTVDVGVIDEAFSQVDYRVEQALRPAMVTRADAQLWVISTMGDDTSIYLNEKVDDGRLRVESGTDRNVAYFEWSAPPDADPADPATWWGCMPALGHTVAESTIRDEFDALPIGEFRRAYLNQRTSAAETVIPLDWWSACVYEPPAIPGPGRRLAIAVDVSPDRTDASIVLASIRPDGTTHLEVLATFAGPRPLVTALTELSQRWKPESVWVDPLGPAGALIPDLKRELWDPTALREATTADVVRACGAIYDLVRERTLRHLDDPILNAAVAGAGSRPLGDAWAWRRSISSTSITSLVAGSLAVWGTQSVDRGAGVA